jgi:hypothetical protein
MERKFSDVNGGMVISACTLIGIAVGLLAAAFLKMK